MKLQSPFALSILLALGLAAAPSLRAQVGNNNPTGPAGAFNGNITTGCSYDVFTGNAMRAITDIVVPGAVGEYPLAFSRVSNSRGFSGEFGNPGAWRHSYNWEMEDSLDNSSQFFSPTFYTLSFPDGRIITFTSSPNDIYFRGPPGVPERFQPLNTGSLLAYLILPDGGKVEFKATRHLPECDPELHPPCTYRYSYKAQAIIDPYGLRTLLAYNGDGTLNTVTDPTGRWLQLIYVTTPWTNGHGVQDRVIDHVTSSDGRSVQYNYGLQAFSPGTIAYTYLGNVVYYGDASLMAVYTYVAPNVSLANGAPLLETARDPMYAGPMKNISYVYATGVNGDNTTPVVGQIRYEKSIDGQTVSNLGVITSGRIETKGDGSFRLFSIPANGYRISSWTDFVNSRYAYKQYDGFGFIQSVQDRNGNTTDIASDSKTGYPTQITYPLTASDTALSKPRATVQYVYGNASCPDPNNRDGNNPYFFYSVTNERGYSTIYKRDANKRVIEVDYPDGGVETFSYNNFGQITTHRLRTGGLETYSYNSRNLPSEYRDAYHLATVDPQNPTVPANATPSFFYTYYTSGPWLDRIQTVTDGRGNTTTMDQYNSRGQPMKTTHPLGQGETTASNIQTGYNSDGTVQWMQDELGHRTSYTYDDYKRVLSVTLPPRAAGSPSPAPTTMSYDHTGGTSTTDYTHTDSNATRVTLPSQKITKTVYDSNLLKRSVTVGYGAWDAATTTYMYDFNDNLKIVKDPNGQTTGLYTQYHYDARNRLTDVDDAMVNDATTPHRNSNGHTISWILDQASNKVSQKDAKNQLTTFDSYDPENHLLQQTVPQAPNPNAVTKYSYFPSGLLQWTQDPQLVATGSAYSYANSYDLMGRRTRMAFPPDAGGALRSEYTTYDGAGNIQTFTNRAGTLQTFSYDGRNRRTGFTWSDGTTPSQTMTYDPASRVTQISNWNSAINVVYFNDNTTASHIESTTNYNDNINRTVSYTYDADGNRATLQYPSGRSFNFNYTSRNQLSSGYETGLTPFQFAYGYDASGNRTFRGLNGSQTFNWAGQSYTTYASNAVNRYVDVQHYFTGGSRRFQYAHDEVNRSKYELRDWSGIGDGFQYDAAGQVTSFQRDGTVNTGNGTVSGATSGLTLDYDANGNRTSTVENGGRTTAYQTVNGLNQYPKVGKATATYDPNGNLITYLGWTYTYDAQNRMTSAVNASNQAYFWYDGLNRLCTWQINGDVTFNVWDGWNLVEEYKFSNVLDKSYLHGAGSDELVSMKRAGQTYYLYQGGFGSTTLMTDPAGQALEYYNYDLTGNVSIYDGANNPRTSSAYNNRFLFTGREYYEQLGIYNYRNRSYHPSLGRFLQPDPTGFSGDASNLYRHCGNDPVNWVDGDGLRRRGAGGRGMPYYPPYTREQIDRGMIRNPRPGYNDELFRQAQEQGDFYRSIIDWVIDRLEQLFPPAPPVGDYPRPADPDKPQPNGPRAPMTMALISGSIGGNQQYSNLVGFAINNAINALFDASQTLGPGIGYVTVTDSRGSRVVWVGAFRGGPYGGFAPGTAGYYGYMNSLSAAAGLYLSFMGGGQPGEGSHPVPYHLM